MDLLWQAGAIFKYDAQVDDCSFVDLETQELGALKNSYFISTVWREWHQILEKDWAEEEICFWRCKALGNI